MSLGCWRDDPSSRAIPTLEGTCSHLDGAHQGRTDQLLKCIKCAKESNFTIMGLQDGGYCTATSDDGEDYKYYGTAPTCDLATGLGESNANQVFKLSK